VVPGACDTHLHVFGPARRYPLRPGLSTAPWSSTWDAYREASAGLGLARQVLVQPSLYAGDNSCLIDALTAAGPGRARGVVMLGAEAKPPADTTLEKWHQLGVRGLRVICFPPDQAVHTVYSPTRPQRGWADAALPRIELNAVIARELGWHLDLLAPGWLIVEMLPALRKLKVDFVLAHLGMFPAADGPGQYGFRALLSLLAEASGHCWVKLSGPYRISQAEDFGDVAPMAAALVAAAPERVVWGSDYPHLSFGDQVGVAGMVRLLDRLLPGPDDRARVLSDNPARLYGFDPGDGGSAAEPEETGDAGD
jgi:2-pyrone-4,6-dicarboxylate lactonase